MSRFVELLRSRSAPRFAVLALMSVGFPAAAPICRRDFPELFQPLCLRAPGTRFGPDARCRAPGAAAIRAAANAADPISTAVPVASAAAARGRSPSLLSGRIQRRVRRRAWAVVLRTAASPSAARDHRHGCAALGGRSPSAGGQRHHDHRRHQRYARPPGEALQRLGPQRSCRPMDTRGRARSRPASN